MGHFDDVNHPSPENTSLTPRNIARGVENIDHLTPDELVEMSEASYGPTRRLLAMRACEQAIAFQDKLGNGRTSDHYLAVLPDLWRLHDEAKAKDTTDRRRNQLDRFATEFTQLTIQQLYNRASLYHEQFRVPELILIEKELRSRLDASIDDTDDETREQAIEDSLLTPNYHRQVEQWLFEDLIAGSH